MQSGLQSFFGLCFNELMDVCSKGCDIRPAHWREVEVGARTVMHVLLDPVSEVRAWVALPLHEASEQSAKAPKADGLIASGCFMDGGSGAELGGGRSSMRGGATPESALPGVREESPGLVEVISS